MKAHLVALLVGELLSVVFGVALFGVGLADITNDTYGLILAFVGIFNGLALIACFVTYAIMLRKKRLFPRIIIGYSVGLCVVCLQSMFVWAGFQTKLFENYTEHIFQLAVAGGEQIQTCSSRCLDFKSGSTDLFETLLAANTQDYELEKAGAAICVLAMISQAVVIVAAFTELQSTAGSEEDSETDFSIDDAAGYAPAPDGDTGKALSANL